MSSLISNTLQQLWQSCSPALEKVDQYPFHLHLTNAKGSAPWWMASAIIKNNAIKAPLHLWITGNIVQAAYIENELSQLMDDARIFVFPTNSKGNEAEAQHLHATYQEAFYALRRHQRKTHIWVAPLQTMMEKISPRKKVEASYMRIARGSSLDLSTYIEKLHALRFQRVDFVNTAGQFAVRGGIIDIFCLHASHPYRIELGGNKIISLRKFDSDTQRSIQEMDYVDISPPQQSNTEKVPIYTELPSNCCVWIDNWKYVLGELQTTLGKQKVSYPTETISAWKSYLQKQSIVEFSPTAYFENHSHRITHKLRQSSQPLFNNNYALLIDKLHKLQQQQYTIYIAFNNISQYERLEQLCEDMDKSITLTPIPFAIKKGFVDHNARIAVFADHQIFNRHHRHNLKRKLLLGVPLQLDAIRSMQPGDYITHIDHGIGIFSGLQKIEVGGKQQEAIRIIYKDGDILYVHIHALHKIAKYVSKNGRTPTVHKLGNDTWNAVKQRTKKKVKELAFDLIKLYAARKKLERFAHIPDNYLQDEMEAAFIYEETPDQQKAIQDVKKDMESRTPMDRLVCGDVGFGKTEVAMRAAYKSVLSGKQVAVLVPTTVLALQHYNSFTKRMKILAPRISHLSRFKTAKQKAVIKRQLKQGEIDIIIGTHALLAEDVIYKDIGLLVVDEEQKFGVNHKEKLKAWKKHIDYLTLTATPIPRTLQFSLMGARDISIMQTPPPNRQATRTKIIAFDRKHIKDIIRYEVNRSGQVFVVHNQASDIVELTNMLKSICPDIVIDYAHGQLPERMLENKIVAFIQHEIDVLVSTNIVENGLDIPNANTIIIHNAHHFGLSDLHQLRGRVGRSNATSYCYLVSPSFAQMNSDSKQRLQTIETHSELGSGMQIAMRDLDLRGTGSILGADQSGFIDQMGYETYQKILNETVLDIKGGDLKPLVRKSVLQKESAIMCDIETEFEVYIPDEYVSASQERMRLYQKMNDISTVEGIEKLRQELADKFGRTPPMVEALLTLLQCKIKASQLGFKKLVQKKETLYCYFSNSVIQDDTKCSVVDSIIRFIQDETDKMYLQPQNNGVRLVIQHCTSIDDIWQSICTLEAYHQKT